MELGMEYRCTWDLSDGPSELVGAALAVDIDLEDGGGGVIILFLKRERKQGK